MNSNSLRMFIGALLGGSRASSRPSSPQYVDTLNMNPFPDFEIVDEPVRGQSRLGSLVEQLFNVGSGFILASLAWQFVVKPVWNIETSVAENLQITAFFTVLSIARGYVWRRLFNHRASRRA